jgi:hypothetical protein
LKKFVVKESKMKKFNESIFLIINLIFKGYKYERMLTAIGYLGPVPFGRFLTQYPNRLSPPPSVRTNENVSL